MGWADCCRRDVTGRIQSTEKGRERVCVLPGRFIQCEACRERTNSAVAVGLEKSRNAATQGVMAIYWTRSAPNCWRSQIIVVRRNTPDKEPEIFGASSYARWSLLGLAGRVGVASLARCGCGAEHSYIYAIHIGPGFRKILRDNRRTKTKDKECVLGRDWD